VTSECLIEYRRDIRLNRQVSPHVPVAQSNI